MEELFTERQMTIPGITLLLYSNISELRNQRFFTAKMNGHYIIYCVFVLELKVVCFRISILCKKIFKQIYTQNNNHEFGTLLGVLYDNL